MEQITQADLLDIAQYEKTRDAFRSDTIDYKSHRRVPLGPDISLTFEDRRTMIFQIQEMMRAERLVDQAAIQEEIDVYNSLLPDKGELSATLFIEITDAHLIKERLHRFLGLTDGRSLWLQVDGEQIFARFEEGRSSEDQISSVHYIRFSLTPPVRSRLADPASEVKLCIDHRDYRHAVSLAPDVQAALAGDLEDA